MDSIYRWMYYKHCIQVVLTMNKAMYITMYINNQKYADSLTIFFF